MMTTMMREGRLRVCCSVSDIGMMGVVAVVGGEVQRSSPYFIYERTSGKGRSSIQGSEECKSKGFGASS